MFLSKARLKASELMEQAVVFLNSKYNQTAHVFTSASPFGQLLTVIANMAELIFTYISHTAEELNISTAQNIETIYGLAQLTGHNAYRGGSAYGMLAIKVNTSSDLIDGNYLIIHNFTRFTITETGCSYFLNLPSDYIRLKIDDAEYVNVNFMQGEPETQTFTSDGTALQSYNPITSNIMTDHDNVAVTVNGKEWKRVESLYDMPADDGIDDNAECFIVKSSVTTGLSIFFGNGSFGKIPPAGATIAVTYIKTDGASGNSESTNLTYSFDDTGTDEYGNSIELDEVLSVQTITPPMLGSNFEDPEFTRLVAPRTSKSFVLATPENYISYLSKYNQYSSVYAYNTKEDNDLYDDNITYLRIIPNMKKKLTSTQDYFELPTNEFLLNNVEKESIINALDNSGRMLINSEVVMVDPVIRKFVINIIVRYFEDIDKTLIKSNIKSKLSTYFLNINRTDIIPVSDIVAIVERIDGVDTCDVFFVNKENEDAIDNGYYYKKKQVRDGLEYVDSQERVNLSYNQDPRLGFDDFGNLKIKDNELFIVKGGWKDRDGNYYTETPEDGKLGPLNIFFIDKVDNSYYNMNMQRKLTTLLQNNS